MLTDCFSHSESIIFGWTAQHRKWSLNSEAICNNLSTHKAELRLRDSDELP